MSYNTKSTFSNTINELLFLSDVDIAHKSVMNTHQSYIKDGEYTKASDYINAQADITPVTAGLFQMIQNRIAVLQDYLLSEDKCNREVHGAEPEAPAHNTIWLEITE